MRTIRLLLITALSGFIVACATTAPPRHESQSDPDTDIAAYRTFGWQQPDGQGDAPLRLLDVHIRNAIRAELTRRGYEESDEAADFKIGYEFASWDKVKSNPFRIGIGVGSWGGNVGGSVGVGTPSVESYQEGRLVVHAVDAQANKEVWLGTVVDRVDQSSLEADAVARVVAITMQDFPTARP